MKMLDIRKYHILIGGKINQFYLEMEKIISKDNPELLQKTTEALKEFEENKDLSKEKKDEILKGLESFFTKPVHLSVEETQSILSVTPEEIEKCFIDGTEKVPVQ